MTPSLAFTSFSATSGSIVLWWALVLKGPVSGLTSGMKGSVRLHPSLRCSSAQVISDQNWCTTLPWGMIPWLQYVQFCCFCCFCYTTTKRVWLPINHSSDIRKGLILFNRDQQGGIKTKQQIMRTIALSVLWKTTAWNPQNSRPSTKTQTGNHLESHLGPNGVHMREKRDEKRVKSVKI